MGRRRVVRLVADAGIAGGVLFVLGAAGVAGAIADGQDWWLALVVFAVAAGVSIFKRRYTGLDEEGLAAADSVEEVPADPAWFLAFRNVPVTFVAAAFLATTAILVTDALAALAGLIAGQALMELRAAYWYFRWERRHAKRLYGTTGRFRPVIDRGVFEDLFVVPNET